MMGQANYFVHYAPEPVPYGQTRYLNESKRLLGVLESALSDGREFLVGGQYTLADIANFCWAAFAFYLGIDLDEFVYVKVRCPFLSFETLNEQAWTQRCYSREKTRKGLNVPKPFPYTVQQPRILSKNDMFSRKL